MIVPSDFPQHPHPTLEIPAMATNNADYTLLFEAGEGEGHWTIEESPDGSLVVTSNAETRRVVEPANHRGWDADAFRAELRNAGMGEELIDRYFAQAGL